MTVTHFSAKIPSQIPTILSSIFDQMFNNFQKGENPENTKTTKKSDIKNYNKNKNKRTKIINENSEEDYDYIDEEYIANE